MSKTQKEIATPATMPQEKQENKYFTTKKITTIAMLVALSIVIKLIGNTLTLTETFRVSFIYIPWLLAGIIVGPIGGCIVSGLSDLLVMFLIGGTFIPLTFVSNLLYPLFIGLTFRFIHINNDYIKVILGAIPSLIFCTLGIGSYALYIFYGYNQTFNFFEYIGLFRATQIIVFAINIVLVCLLIKPLKIVKIIPNVFDEKYEKINIIFVISETILFAMFISGLVLLIVNNLAISSYIILIAFYILMAIYLSLVNLKNIKSKSKVIITLVTLFFLCILALLINLLLEEPTIILNILLPIVAGLIIVVLIVFILKK